MTLALVIALALEAGQAPPAKPEQHGWALVWSDEFEGKTLDPAKWGFDVDCWGGGNDERQCYTASARNATIENGSLVITARREEVRGPALPQRMRKQSPSPAADVTRQFSSARLTTRGKASWTYGRIEVRARLPQGQGTWPAIWMLPEEDIYGGWAASGEIDILEAVNLGVTCDACPGGRETRILGTLHFGGEWPDNKHKGDEMAFPDVLDGDFHTYALFWFPDRMVWQVDGRTFAERRLGEWSTTASDRPTAPFDQPFHLILNLAIGGRLAESRGLGGVGLGGYPKRMEIDWVRVWQIGGTDVSPATGQPAERGK
jgi:beta-glucanase (GH16 family)